MKVIEQELERTVLILLSVQSALLAEISSNLRAVSIDWTEKAFTLYFFFDREITENDQEEAEVVATNVLANFFDNTCETKCIYFPEKKPLPRMGKQFVFARKGTRFEL